MVGIVVGVLGAGAAVAVADVADLAAAAVAAKAKVMLAAKRQTGFKPDNMRAKYRGHAASVINHV